MKPNYEPRTKYITITNLRKVHTTHTHEWESQLICHCMPIGAFTMHIHLKVVSMSMFIYNSCAQIDHHISQLNFYFGYTQFGVKCRSSQFEIWNFLEWRTPFIFSLSKIIQNEHFQVNILFFSINLIFEAAVIEKRVKMTADFIETFVLDKFKIGRCT